MKKISTKIILLSLVNSLFIALLNVLSTIYMNYRQRVQVTADTVSGTSTASSAIAGTAPVQPAGLINLPTLVVISLVASLIFGVVLSYIVGKLIAKPIIKVTEITKRTAEFDLREDELFEHTLKYKDESGIMAKALWDTRIVLREMAAKLQNISSSLALHSHNLSGAADENVRTITQVVSTINEIAEGNSSQAQTINDINLTLSEVVELIDNITAETSLGADNAVKSLDTIKEGQEAVDIQSEKMEENILVAHEANKSIGELSSMIEQVASIVSVITSIADQTNLLALNAAIEAARAGEAGNGFGVVADEIRNLAEESSKAAKEIEEIITETTDKTKLAVVSMATANTLAEEQKKALSITKDAFIKIKNTYDQIVSNFQRTASAMKAVNEKSKSMSVQTQDIASIAEESAASTEEISAAGQQQLASIELIAEASKDLSKLAEELSVEVNKFKIE